VDVRQPRIVEHDINLSHLLTPLAVTRQPAAAVTQLLFLLGVEDLPACCAARLGARESRVDFTGPDTVFTCRSLIRPFATHHRIDNLSM
jgi:hypothetical protein